MSYSIGWDAINLRTPERPAHTEYTVNYPFMERLAGVRKDHPEFMRRWREAAEFDFAWCTNDGPVGWEKRGRVTDMGHAVYLADGSDKRETITCPFKSVEEVLAFDAVAEYGLPDFDDLVAYYEEYHRKTCATFPGCVMPGGYYRTIVSGAINAFGWDLLLEAAAYPKEFEKVVDGFFQLSLHHYKAWAKTSIKVFICHDDMVWSQGPFMRPDFYRKVIFPRYARLWAPLKERGIKLLYCSDALWTEFMPDIAAAGADGFIFEPMNSFEYAVEKFGRTHVIVGSKVDCRTLTFGTRDQIKSELDASLKLGLRCPGWMCAVGNHIPPNVPLDNALFYLDYLRANWKR